MKILESIFVLLFYTIISFSTGISFAQEKTIAQLQTELISPWLVTVEGEIRTRTLRITGAAQKPDGTLLLEAVYGWTDAGQSAIPASASQSGQKNTLQFATQSSSQVVATQTSNGNFEGTFTYKGTTKAIKIEKILEGDLQLKVATAKAARAATIIVKPAADVPASCASFSGEWTGTWSQGGIGQYWLWVVGIDANCVAKFAYLSHPRPPVGFTTVEIKDGALPIVNRSTGGTSIIERHGDELWARYSNPSGGTNNAVFKKVQ